MGLKYLWDTNAVIYYLQKYFSDNDQELMNNIINSYQPAISVITEIELLCWKTTNAQDLNLLSSFISDCVVLQLDQYVKLNTINIRKGYNIKLPDAIIAATALTADLTLISNDKKGFNKVPSLELFTPLI